MYLTVWIVSLCLKYILVDNFFKKINVVLNNAKLSVFSEELLQCLERCIYILLFKLSFFHARILILLFLSFDTGPNTFNENETIAKYEIMDGAPVRGKYSESLKIRTASCLNTELVFIMR